MIFQPKHRALIFVSVILLVAGGIWLFSGKKGSKVENQSVNNTVNAANENIRNLNIKEHQEISSPLTITGEAKGTWFFEASFPVILTDWDGKIIAQGIAKANGDWMTENFVPFEAILQFVKPGYKNNGSLILKKDNPSGLPQNDAALEIPVIFK
ncbi:MAG: hypothetical protein HY918_00835 [Candidatus Doudnabacteria bacterium]|nr:hypothetical protein [Candidatus Doudnabacteria bacterium]